ncbi:MAG: DUF3617 family protein [Filomicrobium sp.]
MHAIHLPITSLFCACLIMIGTMPASAHQLKPGLYEIVVNVELPNLLRTSKAKRVKRCITPQQIEKHDAFRIESDNPLARCDRAPICMSEKKAGFQVNCIGGSGGHADALFTTSEDQFSGTIRMNMGGKNMTVLELQEGRRLGDCLDK